MADKKKKEKKDAKKKDSGVIWKEKEDLAKGLGTGGARKAADAMIKRQKMLEGI